jgi:hypothetical protein
MVPLDTIETTPALATSTSWPRCRYVFDCHFVEENAVDDVDDTLKVLFTLLFLIGLALGVVVAPIYLARATQQVYPDTCLVRQCDSYSASVGSSGFGVNAVVAMSKPCAELVGKHVTCFVKHNVDYNTFSLTLRRPGMITAVTTGVIGWAILLPMIVWFVVIACRHWHNGRKRGAINFMFLWMVVAPLAVYGLCTVAISLPFIVTNAKDDLVNDLCHVNGCKTPDFANVYVKGAGFFRDVYLHSCAKHVDTTVHCYRKSNAVTMHFPNRGLIIGLAITGGFGLLVGVIYTTTKLFKCAGWFHSQLGQVIANRARPRYPGPGGISDVSVSRG